MGPSNYNEPMPRTASEIFFRKEAVHLPVRVVGPLKPLGKVELFLNPRIRDVISPGLQVGGGGKQKS